MVLMGVQVLQIERRIAMQISRDSVSRLSDIGNEDATKAIEQAERLDSVKFFIEGGKIHVTGQEKMFMERTCTAI